MQPICIIALPGNDPYGRNGWCFSTDHDSGSVVGAVPITYYNRTPQEVYNMSCDIWGDLFYNPNDDMEPLFSAQYIDVMKDWVNPSQT